MPRMIPISLGGSGPDRAKVRNTATITAPAAKITPSGMVTRTKQGNDARYAISDPAVFELCDQVCGGVRRQLKELDAILPA